MSNIYIDAKKCCGDELCVKICPTRCLAMENHKAITTDLTEKICLLCGHCVAICPTNAISMSLDGITQSGFSLKGKALPNKEDLATLLKARRSVRNYLDKEIPKDLLLETLQIATYSPTAKNKQYVEWLVIEGKDKVHELAGLVIDYFRDIPAFKRLVTAFDGGYDPIFRGAPYLIFSHCSTEDGQQFGEVDCAIALTQLELLLQTYEIGTCWAGYGMTAAQKYQPFRDALQIPESHTAYAGIMLGYTKTKFYQAPPRKALRYKIIS